MVYKGVAARQRGGGGGTKRQRVRQTERLQQNSTIKTRKDYPININGNPFKSNIAKVFRQKCQQP